MKRSKRIQNNAIKPPEYDAVFVDPEFFEVDVTQFPATVGFVGVTFSERKP